MKEYRIDASRVTNYVAFVEANNESDAQSLADSGEIDWQFIDDDEYRTYNIAEVE